MRIIAGIARNIELAAPPGIGVRPTAVRARKALFDSIGSRLAGSVVLDLCAGSGALALEAASRGAAAATLVEADQRHIRVIEENVARVKKAGVACDFRLINGRAEAVRQTGPLNHVARFSYCRSMSLTSRALSTARE